MRASIKEIGELMASLKGRSIDLDILYNYVYYLTQSRTMTRYFIGGIK